MLYALTEDDGASAATSLADGVSPAPAAPPTHATADLTAHMFGRRVVLGPGSLASAPGSPVSAATGGSSVVTATAAFPLPHYPVPLVPLHECILAEARRQGVSVCDLFPHVRPPPTPPAPRASPTAHGGKSPAVGPRGPGAAGAAAATSAAPAAVAVAGPDGIVITPLSAGGAAGHAAAAAPRAHSGSATTLGPSQRSASAESFQPPSIVAPTTVVVEEPLAAGYAHGGLHPAYLRVSRLAGGGGEEGVVVEHCSAGLQAARWRSAAPHATPLTQRDPQIQSNIAHRRALTPDLVRAAAIALRSPLRSPCPARAPRRAGCTSW
jgi:hypothetical protein